MSALETLNSKKKRLNSHLGVTEKPKKEQEHTCFFLLFFFFVSGPSSARREKEIGAELKRQRRSLSYQISPSGLRVYPLIVQQRDGDSFIFGDFGFPRSLFIK